MKTFVYNAKTVRDLRYKEIQMIVIFIVGLSCSIVGIANSKTDEHLFLHCVFATGNLIGLISTLYNT